MLRGSTGKSVFSQQVASVVYCHVTTTDECIIHVGSFQWGAGPRGGLPCSTTVFSRVDRLAFVLQRAPLRFLHGLATSSVAAFFSKQYTHKRDRQCFAFVLYPALSAEPRGCTLHLSDPEPPHIQDRYIFSTRLLVLITLTGPEPVHGGRKL